MAIADFTLADMVRRNARVMPDATWLVAEEGRLSHGDALRRAEAWAGRLAAAGIGAGDRVALLAQNRPEHLDLLFAAALLGAILVPVNWRLQGEEIAHVLADSAPLIVVAEQAYAEALAPLRAGLPGISGWWGLDGAGQGLDPVPAEAAPACPADVSADQGLLLIHTAAVGGKPRGALLSHRNLLAANLQTMQAMALGPDAVGLALLPLFHISGLGQVLAVQQAGGASLLPRRFDPDAAAASIARDGVTMFFEFAPMLGQILDRAEAGGHDLASLRSLWGLDAPATIARFEAACPAASFFVGFGQSETSGFVSLAPSREAPGSAGRQGLLATLAILDEDDREVAQGQVGEIAVRGPLVFEGYWNLPEDNARTFRAGWHHTGDMGRIEPGGILFYAGRSPAKELIKSGGENVYPAEVEAAIRAHPAVAEVAVIGVPDPQWHEAVKAVCALRPGESLAAAELIAFVGERVARYKRPKHVVFVEALPRNAAGVVDRARVRQDHGEAP